MPVTTALGAQAYVNGRWIDGAGQPYEVINPATEDILATGRGFPQRPDDR